MTKETVRYPDSVVENVEAVVADGVFESKSEFYRFSAEYVLDAVLPDYEPETFDFEEIVDDLNDQHSFEDGDAEAGDGAFLDAVLEVRKRGLRDDPEEAAAHIDDVYETGDVEAVVLEELLRQYRTADAE